MTTERQRDGTTAGPPGHGGGTVRTADANVRTACFVHGKSAGASESVQGVHTSSLMRRKTTTTCSSPCWPSTRPPIRFSPSRCPPFGSEGRGDLKPYFVTLQADVDHCAVGAIFGRENISYHWWARSVCDHSLSLRDMHSIVFGSCILGVGCRVGKQTAMNVSLNVAIVCSTYKVPCSTRKRNDVLSQVR